MKCLLEWGIPEWFTNISATHHFHSKFPVFTVKLTALVFSFARSARYPDTCARHLWFTVAHQLYRRYSEDLWWCNEIEYVTLGWPCSSVGNCCWNPTKSFEHATAVVYGTVLFCEWFMTVCTDSVLLSCIFSMLLEDILLSLGESSIGQIPHAIFQMLPPPIHNCNNHSSHYLGLHCQSRHSISTLSLLPTVICTSTIQCTQHCHPQPCKCSDANCMHCLRYALQRGAALYCCRPASLWICTVVAALYGSLVGACLYVSSNVSDSRRWVSLPPPAARACFFA